MAPILIPNSASGVGLDDDVIPFNKTKNITLNSKPLS